MLVTFNHNDVFLNSPIRTTQGIILYESKTILTNIHIFQFSPFLVYRFSNMQSTRLTIFVIISVFWPARGQPDATSALLASILFDFLLCDLVVKSCDDRVVKFNFIFFRRKKTLFPCLELFG